MNTKSSYVQALISIVWALVCAAPLLGSACTVTTSDGSGASPSGSLTITWSIASTTDPAWCTTENAASIVIQLTDASGAAYGSTTVAPCSAFAVTIPSLPPGTYDASAHMVDGSNRVISSTVGPAQVSVISGLTSSQGLAFPASSFTGSTPSSGTLLVSWDVATSTDPAQCIAHGAANIVIQLTDASGAPYGTPTVMSCGSFMASIVNLPAGTYAMSAYMVSASNDPVTTTVGPVPVTIIGASTTSQAIDFPLDSFISGPGANTGSLVVTWDVASSVDPAQCALHRAASLSIQVYGALGAPFGTPITPSCSAFMTTIPNLMPGTYGVSGQMVDTNNQPVSTVVGPVQVSIVAGASSSQAFDFPANSFTN